MMGSYKVERLVVAVFIIAYQIRMSQSTPNDVEDSLCSKTIPYVRDNSRYFSSLGQRCSIENDAYVVGAMYSKYAGDDADFERDKISVSKRWKDIAYLNASRYDKFGNTTPPPATSLCIYNERLALQQLSSGIYVSTSCNPFELTYCRTEYDSALTLNDYCDCNYLYSVKELDVTSGTKKCFAKAGVPCKFDQDSNINDLLLYSHLVSIACHPSLECKEHNTEERQQLYKRAFHGFGINPVAYHYMKTFSTGYCDCKQSDSKKMIINALNECVISEAPVQYSGPMLLLFYQFYVLYFA